MPRVIDFCCVTPAPQVKIRRMNLKNQLKHYMEIHDLTTAELSRKSGVSKQVLSLWLAGSKPKNIEQVKKVADVLSTTIDELAFGVGRGVSDLGHHGERKTLSDGWEAGVFEVRFRRIRAK